MEAGANEATPLVYNGVLYVGNPAPQFVYNTTNVGKFATGKDKVGRIDAISVETGRTLWTWETRVSGAIAAVESMQRFESGIYMTLDLGL